MPELTENKPALSGTRLEGIPAKELAALRNVTLKESLAFEMNLDHYEAMAKEIWPDAQTVLVSNDEMKGVSQVYEYEGFGYTLLEDGRKSLRTVPNRGLSRMGIDKKTAEAKEADRIFEQNNRNGQFNAETAPEGIAFQQKGSPTQLSDILNAADSNTEGSIFGADPTIELPPEPSD